MDISLCESSLKWFKMILMISEKSRPERPRPLCEGKVREPDALVWVTKVVLLLIPQVPIRQNLLLTPQVRGGSSAAVPRLATS